MSGLRERNKADRDRRILQAASHLFREQGYEGATIERIAEHAQVSPGTIYNYYKNKGDLLVAIVAMEVNEVLNSGAEHIARRHRSAQAAVDRLVGIYFEHSLTYLSKEMWRHAMATATQQPETPFGTIYCGLDERLSQQVCELLARLQASGLIAGDADTVSTGELIFNNLNMMFTVYVRTEAMTLGEVLAAISRQHGVLLKRIAAPAEERAQSRRMRPRPGTRMPARLR